MPKERAIDAIGLDAQGHLFLRPVAGDPQDFTLIYRDASGIRWNTESRAFHAYEPERWDAVALYRQIIAAVLREFGVVLALVPETRWIGISNELRASIENVLPQS